MVTQTSNLEMFLHTTFQNLMLHGASNSLNSKVHMVSHICIIDATEIKYGQMQ